MNTYTQILPNAALFEKLLLERLKAIPTELKNIEITKGNLETEYLQVQDALSSLKTGSYPSFSPAETPIDGVYSNGYMPTWTYIKKIKFVINYKGKPLTARQITDLIINELEVDIWKDKEKKDQGSLYSTISSTLTNNSKPDKDFERSQNERDEHIYSIREK